VFTFDVEVLQHEAKDAPLLRQELQPAPHQALHPTLQAAHPHHSLCDKQSWASKAKAMKRCDEALHSIA
jgi:hypothetical protein